MKKAISTILALAMLATPLVGSVCFANKSAGNVGAYVQSQDRSKQYKSDKKTIVKAGKVAGYIAAGTVAVMGATVAGLKIFEDVLPESIKEWLPFLFKSDACHGENCKCDAESNVTESVAGNNVTESVVESNVTESVAGNNATESVVESNVTESVAGNNATESVVESNVTESVAGNNATESVVESNVTESVAGSNVTESVVESNVTESVAGNNVTESVVESNVTESVAGSNVTESMNIDAVGQDRGVLSSLKDGMKEHYIWTTIGATAMPFVTGAAVGGCFGPIGIAAGALVFVCELAVGGVVYYGV